MGEDSVSGPSSCGCRDWLIRGVGWKCPGILTALWTWCLQALRNGWAGQLADNVSHIVSSCDAECVGTTDHVFLEEHITWLPTG